VTLTVVFGLSCPFHVTSILDQSGLNLYLLKVLVIEHAQFDPEIIKPGLQATQVVLEVELHVSQNGTVHTPTVVSETQVFEFGNKVNPVLHYIHYPVLSSHLPQFKGQLMQSLVPDDT
jgi:hypothetical protein